MQTEVSQENLRTEVSIINCLQCGVEINKPKKKFCSPQHKNIYNHKHLYNYKYSKQYRSKTKENYLSHLLSYKKRRDKISLEDLINIWNKQEGKCAITGKQLTHEQSSGKCFTNASIDRIDSSKGYEVNNIQLVCHTINVMKTDLSMDEFLAVCKEIVAYNE